MKIRCDAWYAKLSKQEQQNLLCEVRLLPWKEAVSVIAKKLSCDKPSRSAYYRWINKVDTPPQQLEQRLRLIEDKLDAVAISVLKMYNLFSDQTEKLQEDVKLKSRKE